MYVTNFFHEATPVPIFFMATLDSNFSLAFHCSNLSLAEQVLWCVFVSKRAVSLHQHLKEK